jgi:hypothetical protein
MPEREPPREEGAGGARPGNSDAELSANVPILSRMEAPGIVAVLKAGDDARFVRTCARCAGQGGRSPRGDPDRPAVRGRVPRVPPEAPAGTKPRAENFSRSSRRPLKTIAIASRSSGSGWERWTSRVSAPLWRSVCPPRLRSRDARTETRRVRSALPAASIGRNPSSGPTNGIRRPPRPLPAPRIPRAPDPPAPGIRSEKRTLPIRRRAAGTPDRTFERIIGRRPERRASRERDAAVAPLREWGALRIELVVKGRRSARRS